MGVCVTVSKYVKMCVCVCVYVCVCVCCGRYLFPLLFHNVAMAFERCSFDDDYASWSRIKFLEIRGY